MPFKKGNKYGIGRPKGSVNKFTQIKQEMADAWQEEGGKEHFKKLFNKKQFIQALKYITVIMPKEAIVKTEDKDGNAVPLVVYLPEVKKIGDE